MYPVGQLCLARLVPRLQRGVVRDGVHQQVALRCEIARVWGERRV